MNQTKEKIMNNIFIAQTAKDYDMPVEIVREYYRLYWPENFYKKLEEYIKDRADVK